MSTKPVTTDSIIQTLIDDRDARLAACEPVDVRAVEQEIIAHKQLARLRAERAERVKAKDFLRVNDLDAQIQHWVRFISVDVDEKLVDAPAKDSTELVDPLAPAGPAAQA